VLLETGEHGGIAVIHHRAAMTRHVARAGIVLPLRRSAGGDQNERHDKKKSDHLVPPSPKRTLRVLDKPCKSGSQWICEGELQRGNRDGDGQHQAGLAKCPGE
jgi:hypothetical protein